MASLDGKLVQFMKTHKIEAATMAIKKDGKIVLSHGYGYSDRNKTLILAPDTLMRIASITKPFTAAAVKTLIREGKLKLDTKVMDVIDVQPFGGKVADPRWYDITVGHLLIHRGGWDRNATTVEWDPMFKNAEIAKEMKLAQPIGPSQIISYMISRPLEFSPQDKQGTFLVQDKQGT